MKVIVILTAMLWYEGIGISAQTDFTRVQFKSISECQDYVFKNNVPSASKDRGNVNMRRYNSWQLGHFTSQVRSKTQLPFKGYFKRKNQPYRNCTLSITLIDP